jgi:alpha-amylase
VGRFRQAHRAVGAGVHRTHQQAPYIFSRVLGSDTVLIGMNLGTGTRTIPVFDLFPEGTELVDNYSGARGRVTNGSVTMVSQSGLVLLSR